MPLNPSSAHADEDDSYRPLSGTAVVGLLLGLASPLAFLGQPLWCLPPAAVCLSIFALRRIYYYRPTLGGRSAALAGLLLGIVFTVAVPVEHFSYLAMIRGEAVRFFTGWLALLHEGKYERAHQLTLPPPERRPSDTALDDHYPPGSHRRTQLDQFLAEPAVRAMRTARKPDFRVLATEGPTPTRLGLLVRLTVELVPNHRPPAAPEREDEAGSAALQDGSLPRRIEVQLLRVDLGNGRAAWQAVGSRAATD
ncbi:MAG: DUF4190 domain-containing protein [Planctomycetota bacterium]